MKKKENKLVDVEITEEEIKEEELEQEEEEKNKKKGLIVKVAIFAGCAVLLGGGITTGVLMRKNNISPDNKVIIDVESPIFNDDNTIDVPTVTPIVDELDPVVIGPTIAPDEKDPNEIDPNEIGNGIEQGDDIDEIIEVEPTVVPVEPTVKPEPTAVPTPVPNQGGNGGNDPKEVTPTVTPEPTKAPTPKPTVAPTPTPIVEKDDEYDKAMYDKFIKMGEEFTSYLRKNKYGVIEGESLYDVYAYMYLINADYLDNGTVKKLVNDGILDVENLIDGISGFQQILYSSEGKILLNGDKFIDMSNLCLDDDDKKNTTQFINAVNTLAGTDADKTYAAIDNFIFASANDKKTNFTLTVDEMNTATLIVYIDSARTFRNALSSIGLKKSFVDPIKVDGGDEYIDDRIADLTQEYKSINLSSDNKAPYVYIKI